MLDVRLKKAIRELTGRKSRTFLTWLGLSLGLVGFGTAAVAYIWLRNDLTANFLLTNPPNIVIDFETRKPGQAKLLESLEGVEALELREKYYGRFQIRKDRGLPVIISVIEDFEHQRVAKIFRQKGAWPPPPGTALIERSGAVFLGMDETSEESPRHGGHGHGKPVGHGHGDAFHIQFSNGKTRPVRVTGLAFDPGMAPSTMERMLYAYITPETATIWGLRSTGANYLVKVTKDPLSTARAWEVSREIRQSLAQSDLGEYDLLVPNAGEHPHQFQLRSILVLFAGLGLVAFFLCTVLVINLMNAVLANQLRQVGVLKAIGATRGQVVRLYGSALALLGMMTSVLAVPVSSYLGHYCAELVAKLLNFDLLTASLPVTFYVFLALIGVLLPVLAGLWPIWNVASHSVGAAIRDDCVVTAKTGGAWRGVTQLPLTMAMAIRNGFRRRLRLGLTVLTLAVGLVTFMAAMNVRSSLMQTSDTVAKTKNYDVGVSFQEAGSEARLRAWLEGFQAVNEIEFWGRDKMWQRNGEGEIGNPVTVFLLPQARRAMSPYLIEGQWLNQTSPNGIVVNQRYVRANPQVKVGKSYRFKIRSSEMELPVIGIIKEFRGATVYMNRTTYASNLEDDGGVSLALVGLKDRGYGPQAEFKRTLEEQSLEAPVKIGQVQTTMLMILIVRNHLDIIAWTLGLVAIVMLAVGGLGMGSGMGLSIMERERELGVMRVLGGKPGWILRLFVFEAWLMAFLAWFLALLAATPISRAISNYFGSLIVQYPFDYRGSLPGIGFALVAAVIVAFFAALVPAWKYLRAPVAQSLRCT